MALAFSDIPEVVIDYVRAVFAKANDKVSTTLAQQPSMWEETLDHILVMELTASPPAFFATEQIGLAIESHWLGNRWMWDRWEIADIAFFVTLRKRGQADLRKVALLQTKRLYPNDITVDTLDDTDFRIGIGRIIDNMAPLIPISSQRTVTFDGRSRYGALNARSQQAQRMDAYAAAHGIPIYYGLYNPPGVPSQIIYPAAAGSTVSNNAVGCRIISATEVHPLLAPLRVGQSPTFDELALARPLDPSDAQSTHGWRLEHFIADEVLRCREGQLFDDATDPNLRALLYERGRPISAAISIVIDFGSEPVG